MAVWHFRQHMLETGSLVKLTNINQRKIMIGLSTAVYWRAFQEAIERAESLNGELVPVDFGPFCEIAELLYNSAFVAERYAGIRSFIDSKVCHKQECI